jgi:parallel beta-helix repeat protein
MGNGLWDDGGNIRTRYSENRIDNNWGAGIKHEISYDAEISGNYISGNGFALKKGWLWGAGIEISSSGGLSRIDIVGNTVVNNYNGISLLQADRYREAPDPWGPHVVQNVSVHDNRILMRSGQSSGAVQDNGDTAIFNSRHNRFETNSYYLDSVSATHFAWTDRSYEWVRWRAVGQDANGRASSISS